MDNRNFSLILVLVFSPMVKEKVLQVLLLQS